MKQKIIFRDPSTDPTQPGGLILVHPSYNGPVARQLFPSEAELLQHVLSQNIPEGTAYELVEEEDWPMDHSFVDAWECDQGKINVNMPKARLVHMDRIRRARNAALVTLDVPYMRAVEAGDVLQQQAIAAEKQILRDIPQTFKLSGAKTPGQLKDLWPAELT